MSQYENSERLLSEALAQALDLDLAVIPPTAQIEAEHHYSRRFERNMRQIMRRYEKGVSISDQKRETRGVWSMRYGSMAAALLCVVGLGALAGVMSQMDMGSADQAAGVEESAPVLESGTECDTEEAVTEEAVTEEFAEEEAITESADESKFCAPDWQEQLLAESVQADKLVYWRLGMVYEDGSIELESGLESELRMPSQTLQKKKTVRVSGVYEVYYEDSTGEWTRVYHTAERDISECSGGMLWGDCYRLEELGMTRAGNYRLVRQVNHWRQVLQLTLDER